MCSKGGNQKKLGEKRGENLADLRDYVLGNPKKKRCRQERGRSRKRSHKKKKGKRERDNCSDQKRRSKEKAIGKKRPSRKCANERKTKEKIPNILERKDGFSSKLEWGTPEKRGGRKNQESEKGKSRQ